MYRKILLLLTFILIAGMPALRAQSGDVVGVRFGGFNAIQYKHYLDEQRSLEGRFGLNRKNRAIKLLFQFEQPASMLYRDKLFFYYGFGLHTGYQRNENSWEFPGVNIPRFFPALGFDAVLGTEYRLSILPVSVGVDFNPSFEIFAPFNFWLKLLDFGFTIKYTLND